MCALSACVRHGSECDDGFLRLRSAAEAGACRSAPVGRAVYQRYQGKRDCIFQRLYTPLLLLPKLSDKPHAVWQGSIGAAVV